MESGVDDVYAHRRNGVPKSLGDRSKLVRPAGLLPAENYLFRISAGIGSSLGIHAGITGQALLVCGISSRSPEGDVRWDIPFHMAVHEQVVSTLQMANCAVRVECRFHPTDIRARDRSIASTCKGSISVAHGRGSFAFNELVWSASHFVDPHG